MVSNQRWRLILIAIRADISRVNSVVMRDYPT